MLSGPILLVADLFHPINSFAVKLLLDGDVRHGLGESRAMPVFLAQRKPNHVAGMYFLDGTVLALYSTATGCDDQVYHAVRAPGSNVTLAPTARAGSCA
jgi:hypothetical protein